METKFNIGQVVFHTESLKSYRVAQMNINLDGVEYGLATASGTKWVNQDKLTGTVEEAVDQIKNRYRELTVKIEGYLYDLDIAAKALEKAIKKVKEDKK